MANLCLADTIFIRYGSILCIALAFNADLVAYFVRSGLLDMAVSVNTDIYSKRDVHRYHTTG